MLADKDAVAVAEILAPHISQWFCAGLSGPRGQSGQQLANRIKPVAGDSTVISCTSVESSLAQALDVTEAEDSLLVFGSFLTAASVLAAWPEAKSAWDDRISPAAPV
jgi:dihydrofolate synthase/folylpolyglutamate synthase